MSAPVRARPHVTPARPRRSLGRRPRAALRSVHVVVATAWTGLACVMLTLPLVALAADTPAHTLFALGAMDLVGGTIIPFLAVGTVLSGVALGLGTPWGLVRHRWVVAKTVLSLAVIVTSVAFSTRWLDRAQLAGGTDPDALRLLAAASVAHLVMLGAATVLSVEKPGRRIRRGFRR